MAWLSACATLLLQRPCEHLQVVGDADVYAQRRARLKPAVHHAVLAARVIALAVALPGSLRHQTFECLIVAVRDQIAGALPTFDVVGRIAPRRARHLTLALEEL